MTSQTATSEQPVETEAQFDERMARGYAESAARVAPAQDPFRRLPVHEDVAF